jgi:translation initiation factor 2 alpha subunit (eIF-2alpha)
MIYAMLIVTATVTSLSAFGAALELLEYSDNIIALNHI